MLQEYFGKLFPCKKVSVHPCRRRTARRGASPKAASVGPTNSSLSWAETSAAKPRHNTRELSHWETDSGFQARLKDTETLKEIHLSHWKLIFSQKKVLTWFWFRSSGHCHCSHSQAFCRLSLLSTTDMTLFLSWVLTIPNVMSGCVISTFQFHWGLSWPP